MRIVAGKYRHRLLVYPDDAEHIRPTKDRIREALFSSLGDITNYVVLDLYAGSGAMGIEALSRGASKACFVDNNLIAIKTIKKNLTSLNIDNGEVIMKDDFDALESFKNHISFNLVILDPPYKLGKYEEVIKYLVDNNLIKEKGIIVTECDHEFNMDFIKCQKIKSHRYGEIIVNVIYF